MLYFSLVTFCRGGGPKMRLLFLFTLLLACEPGAGFCHFGDGGGAGFGRLENTSKTTKINVDVTFIESVVVVFGGYDQTAFAIGVGLGGGCPMPFSYRLPGSALELPKIDLKMVQPNIIAV